MSQEITKLEPGTPILVDGPVVIVPKHLWDSHAALRERAEMKLTQLEGTEYDDFGGIGTGEDALLCGAHETSRAAYIKVYCQRPTILTNRT